jgi:hypothetical protein
MSIKVMGMVWDLDNQAIDREEKYILLAYADHADHKGYNIYPAIGTIMQKTGYKERAAQIITRSLVSKGFLIADGRGPRGTNKWRIPLDRDGVRIAPAKNAPPQNEVDWGADGKEEGVHPDAPEPSETSEPNKYTYIWEKITDSIKTQMPRASFQSYVMTCKLYSIDEDVVIIEAKDELTRAWLQDRMGPTFQQVLIGITGRQVSVRFVVLVEAEL